MDPFSSHISSLAQGIGLEVAAYSLIGPVSLSMGTLSILRLANKTVHHDSTIIRPAGSSFWYRAIRPMPCSPVPSYMR